MYIFKQIWIPTIILAFLSACGSGEESAPPPDTSVTSDTVYGPTEGITYICSSGYVGKTAVDGSYICDEGDNVTFFLGDTKVATVDANDDITTPYDLFPGDTLAALNYVRLLQAMDSDGDLSYGAISLDPALINTLPENIDFNSPTFQADVEALLGVPLISLEAAQTALNNAVLAAGGTIPQGSNIPVARITTSYDAGTNTIHLDGSSSSDADGDAITYLWSLTSKPTGSTSTLSSTTSVTPNLVADKLGTYSFSLVVSDTLASSEANTTSYTVATGTFPPVANAGIDQGVVTGNLVTLDGTKSSDPTGQTLTYAWTIQSQPIPNKESLSDQNASKPTFTANDNGTYVFRLIVNNGTYNSVYDEVIVTAATGNAAPVANAGPDQTVGTGSQVTLDGAGYDANGDSLTYAWSVVSQPSGSNITLSNPASTSPTFSANYDGEYVLSLTVNDGTINSAADTVTIFATTANVPPVANAGADQNVLTTSTVDLNGSASSDADGDFLTYSWAFFNKPGGSSATISNPTNVSPSFDPDVDGEYIVRLTVNDGQNSAFDDVTIISTTANAAPVANAGADASGYTNIAVALNGSASSDANPADTLTYHWSIVSKPTGSIASISPNDNSTTAATPDFVTDTEGSYQIQLIVNDGTVNSVADTVNLTILKYLPIKRTGQTTSIRAGDDASYSGTKGVAKDYVRSGNSVTDNVTGLMWQDDNSIPNLTYSQATSYCANLNLDGHTDWRLPESEEMLGLIDFSQDTNYIDTAFVNTSSSYYWTNTLYYSTPLFYPPFYDYYYHLVQFYNYGYVDTYARSDTYRYVRCVRGEKRVPALTRDSGRGVVIDTQSKLIWQDNTLPSTRTWQNAISYCEALTHDGSSNWRLANINELMSVIDFQNPNGVLNSVFSNNPSKVWSSTYDDWLTYQAFSLELATANYSTYRAFVMSKNQNDTKTPKCVRDLP